MIDIKKECRICHSSELTQFHSFGEMPIVNAYLKKQDLEKPEYKYPLAVGFCRDCKMVQLMIMPPYDTYIIPDENGKTHYSYVSSTSQRMVQHFNELAKEVERRFLDNSSKVVDIGGNDGILLKTYKKRENVLNIEPSDNVADVARASGIESVSDFFSEGLARRLVKEKGKFKVIHTNNVFLNIANMDDFLKGINHMLEDKGVFISEDPYLLDILSNKAYDQIYEAHGCFFSISSLSRLFEKHNMEIFDAEHQWVHGGSMRIYVSKKGRYDITGRPLGYLEREKERGIESLESFLDFSNDIRENRGEMRGLLKGLKMAGKRLVGYGAAAKGVMVQNYCKIGPDILDYISDSTPEKQGMFTPGMHIPIVHPDIFHEDKEVDYAVLFPWNHAREIIEKERDFFKRGGKFIVHLPHPRILELED